MLQSWLRRVTGGIMSSIGQFLWNLGVHPDFLTILGFLMVGIASAIIALGHLQVGAIVLVLGLPLDALDGAVARAMQQPNRKFGGILDSTLDRYADALLFGGLAVYYFQTREVGGFELSLLALAGSYGTSYIRARAGEAGLVVKIGVMDRLVRVILLLVGLFFSGFLLPILAILAIGTNFTAIQRLWYCWNNLE